MRSRCSLIQFAAGKILNVVKILILPQTARAINRFNVECKAIQVRAVFVLYFHFVTFDDVIRIYGGVHR